MLAGAAITIASSRWLARHQKEKTFFQLAERFHTADDPEQVKQLGGELGRFIFGE